ncbi:MAG TPA: histidine kinase [Cyanobacteria bacterium UBA11149]|nr:histidine kinase [Cyanobacteria bacterium UBA11367]HBE60692.1 histidine kinase [Cyanobacteria bacterium UBA11366]HBK65690.1 histidine kinase [Cyanobacteria bacterium UBA11166]HBR72995.1 histidine kinase [Cyanobacteria bacterium UBA11159]HBS69432.1 histidine kinase [Cyanobacteria bacterium UBA11153]HBW91949.1 histidine kinase [Cyanobacteria bacterium UBA11149]HCA96012.1 histidine kinase [Cyanobacteria bacterium UBA9226]
MTKRSLTASPDGIKRAKQAFLRKGWTQEYLAGEVGIKTRQPIWKFFSGKPLDRHIFMEICFCLDLNFEEIAILPQDRGIIEAETITSDFTALVDRVRCDRYDKIQDQCGTLRLLDITRPIDLEDLYVDVNILEEIPSQQWLEIADLQIVYPEDFDRLGLGKIRLDGVPGLQAVQRYGKLMVLGKPGSGKTTFLQYIAVQCNQGKFQPDLVPVFIRMKNFVEDAFDPDNLSLLDYIGREFQFCHVSTEDLEILLVQGKLLILLDGLDEIPEAATDRAIKEIRHLAESYYKNKFIITCRLAASEYRFCGFTEVEIADFNQAQIQSFVKKWFGALARNSPEVGLKKASLFWEQLQMPENQPIRELAVTPILLNLTCLVFQNKADFPTKRADLYKQGLDLLLIRWDEARGIKRDGVYRNLSLPQKLHLMSKLGFITFERGDYFFEESMIQHLIADYLRTLSDAEVDLDTLELDSAAVLQSIEAQHGLLVERARRIYSFSHLTFQEYFTAKAIVADGEQFLTTLAEHLTETRWREVFLLTAQMSPNPDRLLQLIEKKIQTLISIVPHSISPIPYGMKTLSGLLNWAKQKSLAVKTPYKSAAVRAFYFILALPPHHRLAGNQILALAIDENLAREITGELALDLALVHGLTIALTLTPELFIDRLNSLHQALNLKHLTESEAIGEIIGELKNQLPQSSHDGNTLREWWIFNGEKWTKQLRLALIQYRDIGWEWQLDEEEQNKLDLYYYSSGLVVDCLNSNSQVTSKVRKEVEEMLFS